MAELPEGFSIAEDTEELPEGFSVSEDSTKLPEGFSVINESPTTGDIVKGVGAEIGIGVGGQLAGTAIGTAILPGIGTGIGYVVGSVGSGITGSIAAQKIEGQDDISWGRAIAAGLINLAPGGSAKSVKGGVKITNAVVGRAAAKEGAKGAAFGVTEATSRALIDEGRLPTKEELAQYGGAGALFGTSLGAATPKIGKTFDKFLGKSTRQIDEDIASGVIEFKDLKQISKVEGAEGEKVLRGTVEQVKARVKSEAAVEVLVDDAPLVGVKARLLSILAPSKVVGKEARNEALRFKKLAAADEELGSKIEKKVSAAIAKDASVEAKVEKFLAGGDIDPSLGRLGDELTVYRNRLDELQGEVIQQLEVDHMANLGPEKLAKVTDKILKLKGVAETKSIRKEISKLAKQKEGLEATPNLIRKIKKSREDQNFTRREYKMFTDSEFVPSAKLRGAAVEEFAQTLLKRGQRKTITSARTEASRHFDKLEKKSARSRKLAESRGAAAQPLKAALKQRKNVGAAERAWLGEITDTGERIRGTLSGVGKMVARNKTDANIATILQKNGLAVPSESKVEGLMELRLKSGEPTGLHVKPEVQASINRIYLDGAQARSSNPIIGGVQDLYSSAVGLSKATKVLLNPPSYAVQFYGNTMNLLGMGVNPLGGAGRGIRLALAEFGGLDYIMSPSGSEARQAFLKEMNDMTKYGIKGENILESDIRDAFERGLFSKAIEKPVGFFGKAYAVPDTVGRYVGWKAQQETLKKIYPHLDDESVKRLGAEIINDTYQNYDRLSGTVKSLSRSGIIPQFASFTAEFIRNQYNQAKIIKQMLGGTFGADLGVDIGEANLTAMRLEGAKRMTALTTIYAGTAAAIDALNADGGVTDENKDAIQDSLPSWDNHKKLAIRMSEDGKSGSYANMSYVAPQALGMAAFDAAMSDTPLDNLRGMLVEEFFGEGSFVNRGLMEAVNNRNDRGNKISYNENDLINAKERLGYFIKETFRPGISREIDKMDEAARGVGDLTVSQVLARQVGYRINTFNLAENNKFMQMESVDNANGSKREYTSERDRGNLRPEDLEAVYQNANKSYLANMQQVRKSDDNLKKTNHTLDERIQVMKDAGVSSKNILATINGKYSDIPRVALESTSDIYDSLPTGAAEKRKAILEIRKTDRALSQRLEQTMKREIRDERRGITPIDSLMKNLDVAERARLIVSHPNPQGYLREMRQKGIATDKVVELVRLMSE